MVNIRFETVSPQTIPSTTHNTQEPRHANATYNLTSWIYFVLSQFVPLVALSFAKISLYEKQEEWIIKSRQ